MSTKIYVEGGGNQKRTVTACRIAFGKYFEKVVPYGMRPQIIACGSRDQAYKDFKKDLDDPRYDRVLLLVDAEDQVAVGDDGWQHLRRRDKWIKPNRARQNAAHLMVQCMESWFLADKSCLKTFYDQGFNEKALPKRKEIELILKKDVSAGLENATKYTQKGLYHKTRHGFDILALIDPKKVEAVSRFAAQLHKCVLE